MRTRSDGFDNMREGDMPRLRQQAGHAFSNFREFDTGTYIRGPVIKHKCKRSKA
jgi:hypothetical protein